MINPIDDLPTEIMEYLLKMVFESERPAYLRIDQDGLLQGWGGRLDVFGIHGLQTGVAVEIQIPFLEGMLPADSADLSVPLVKVDAGTSFDIHVFKRNRCDWVLLVDTSAEAFHRQLVRQLFNFDS